MRLRNLRQHTLQYTLFSEEHRKQCVAEAMDNVNDRFGTFTVAFASVLDSDSGARVISPAWRPEGSRYVAVE